MHASGQMIDGDGRACVSIGVLDTMTYLTLIMLKSKTLLQPSLLKNVQWGSDRLDLSLYPRILE
jgi:hypothetical protein